MTLSNRRPKRQMRLVTSLLLTALVCGCGSRVSGGNTGSETHWLQSCNRDADCGVYSCHCGICSRSCKEDEDCNVAGAVESHCSDTSSNAQCDDAAPKRICVEDEPLTSTSDAEVANSSNASTNGETPSTDEVTSPPSELEMCDGSDDVRFIYSTSGGFVSDDYAFTGRYGWSFLAIDGKCNFWGSTSLGEVVTGTLTDETALEDYQTSEFGRLDRYENVVPNRGCPDADETLVWDPSGTVHGSQCGLPESLSELGETFAKANQLMNDVNGRGVRSDGSLRLLIIGPVEGASAVMPWPLDLDPSAMIPAERLDYEEMGEPFAGIAFSAGARAEALRDVISGGAPVAFEYASTPPVSFEAVLRDDVPPKVLAALEHASLDAYFKQDGTWGVTCSRPEDCASSLTCQEHTTEAGGGAACNTCVLPNDPNWLCRSNDDCCGDLVCCLDCGEKSGTCIAEADPCETCLDNGSSWVFPNSCDSEACVPDSACYPDTCPGPCTPDNCRGCGAEGDCWAAGCGWSAESEYAYCGAPVIPAPAAEPCEVTTTDESLPGVTIHLETDNCTVFVGRGGQFRYRVEFTQSLDFTTVSSGGSCGLCGKPTDAQTWTQFTITGDGQSYCPECDVGCCPPTEADPTTVDPQTIEGAVDWPGLRWNGPSDTDNQPEGEFPPGDYSAILTVAVPGVGEVSATLPITVRPPLQQ